MLTTPKPEKEYLLLGRLSVFAGSWTLAAAEAVCGGDELDVAEIRDLLRRMVDNSLVTEAVEGGETRYRLAQDSDLVERGECERELQRRHRDWYLALAEYAEVKVWESEAGTWLARLGAEHDNFRAALRWSMTQPDGAEAALRLAAALRGFWFLRGHLDEGRRWTERALKHGAEASPAVLARALQAAAFFAFEQGDLGPAEHLADRGLALARTLENRENHILLLMWMGKTVRAREQYDQAETLLSEAIALARQIENRRMQAAAAAELARVPFLRGDYERASAIYGNVLDSARALGNQWYIAYALRGLGACAFRLGQSERAQKYYLESLRITGDPHDPAVGMCLRGLADTAVALGHHQRAATLYAAVETSWTVTGKLPAPGDRADFDRQVGAIRERLPESDFAAAWTEGQTMTLEQAVEYPLGSESA